jgi:hypothetical protein
MLGSDGVSAIVSASHTLIWSVEGSCQKLWIVPEIEYQHETKTGGAVEITSGVGDGLDVGAAVGLDVGDGVGLAAGEEVGGGGDAGGGVAVGVAVGEGCSVGVGVGVGVGVAAGSSSSDLELFCSLDSATLSM